MKSTSDKQTSARIDRPIFAGSSATDSCESLLATAREIAGQVGTTVDHAIDSGLGADCDLRSRLDSARLGHSPLTDHMIEELAMALRLAAYRIQEGQNATNLQQALGLEAILHALRNAARPATAGTLNANFFRAIGPHLDALGWKDQKRLAKEWGFGEAQVSSLKSGNRYLQIEHVNKLAVAIAQGFDRNTEATGRLSRSAADRPGLATLHLLLDSMLSSAGFSVFVGGKEQNTAWRRLMRRDSPGQRVIRAGYFFWPPFAQSGGGRTPVEGLAIDLMELVARLMGATVQWVPVSWPALHDPLAAGEIDLYPPVLMRIPMRMLDFNFSKPISNIYCMPTALIATSQMRRLLRGPDKTGQIKAADLHLDRIVWVTGKSEVTHFLARLFDNAGEIDDSNDFSSIREACEFVLRQPFDHERQKVRAFPTEHVTAAEFDEASGGSPAGAAVRASGLPSSIGLSLAFAVDPSEPKLLDVVNACLSEIERQPDVLHQLMRKYPGVNLGTRASDANDLATFIASPIAT